MPSVHAMQPAASRSAFASRAALIAQRRDLRGSWMMVGEWLGSHPPLTKRLWALAPDLDEPQPVKARAASRALRVAFAVSVVVVVGVAAVYAYLPRFGVK